MVREGGIYYRRGLTPLQTSLHVIEVNDGRGRTDSQREIHNSLFFIFPLAFQGEGDKGGEVVRKDTPASSIIDGGVGGKRLARRRLAAAWPDQRDAGGAKGAFIGGVGDFLRAVAVVKRRAEIYLLLGAVDQHADTG